MSSSTNWEGHLCTLTTADLFRATWPRHAAKRAAQAAHGPVATAKRWVTGRFTSSADTLLRMAAENIELRAELIRRLEAFGYADTNMAPHPGMGAEALRGVGGADGRSAGSAAAGGAQAVRVKA